MLLRYEHHPVLGGRHLPQHLPWSKHACWGEAGGSPTGQQSANTANWIVWPLRPPRTTALCLPMPGGQTGFQTQLFKRQLSLYLLFLILYLWCIFWRGILNGHINARADTNHCHLIFATHLKI